MECGFNTFLCGFHNHMMPVKTTQKVLKPHSIFTVLFYCMKSNHLHAMHGCNTYIMCTVYVYD